MPAERLTVEAVLFDLDGTLADSAGDLALALNHVRAGRGLPPVPAASLRAHASSGARGLLAAGMDVRPDHPEYAALREEFLAHYERCLVTTTVLFAGVDRLLAEIDARGLAWGIVTNKHTRFTLPVVRALGLDAGAGTVISGDTTPHAKPHPAPLLRAAQDIGIAPGACVYVGDDLRDVEAGNAAGMRSIVASYGYMGTAENPARWPATGWIDAPLDLLRWLPETATRDTSRR